MSDDEFANRRDRDRFHSERAPARDDLEPRGRGGYDTIPRRGGRGRRFSDERDSYGRGRSRSPDGRGGPPMGYDRDRDRDWAGRDRNYTRRRSRSPSRSYSPPPRHRQSSIYDDSYGRGEGRRRGNSTDGVSGGEQMLSLVQFLTRHNDDCENDDQAVRLYKEYKQNFSKKKAKAYFDAHKDLGWFRDRYHPVQVARQQAGPMSTTACGQREEDFMGIIESKEKPHVSLAGKDEAKARALLDRIWARIHPNEAQWLRDDDDTAAVTSNVIIVRGFPAATVHNDILAALEAAAPTHPPEAVWFTSRRDVSDRQAWVRFAGDVDATKVCAGITNMQVKGTGVTAIPAKPMEKKTKQVDFGTLQDELKEARWAAAELNKKRSLGDTVAHVLFKNADELLTTDDTNEKENVPSTLTAMQEALDALVLYMRVVHLFCFYSAMQCDDYECLVRQCGYVCVRGRPGNPLEVAKRIKAVRAAVGEKVGEDDAEALGRVDPDEAVDKFCAQHTTKIAEGKYQCMLSMKKFKGPEFIKKHILKKFYHEATDDVVFLNNFLEDKNHDTLDGWRTQRFNGGVGGGAVGRLGEGRPAAQRPATALPLPIPLIPQPGPVPMMRPPAGFAPPQRFAPPPVSRRSLPTYVDLDQPNGAPI